jgi:glycosyltransferase involved in cell wall biosynthesis
LRRDAEALATWKEYFNGEDYLALNPDVAHSGLDPKMHFLLTSCRERRDPSARFDTRYYLGRYLAVLDSGVNPLVHYALFGKREGRSVSARNAPAGAGSSISAAATPALPASESPAIPAANVTQGECAAVEPPPASRRIVNNDWRRDYPLVSAVIPVFNNAQYLEEGIRSILNQTFTDVEVIVVEGGSTDPAAVDTVRRLEALGLPRTRFAYRPERHHVGDNKNFGAGMARGRYVFWLDQDDMIGGVYLEVAVFLAEVYGYDLVYPSLRAFGAPNARWAYGDSNLRWFVTDPSYPQILLENQVPNCALCRRGAWAHFGGYRDFGTFKDYISEDWDFWIRYLGHGYRGISIRQCLHFYRVHDSGMTATYKPDLDEQRQRLREVNASLIAGWQPTENAPPLVWNPYSNLRLLETDMGATLIGLPATPSAATAELALALAKSAAETGRRTLVVTSWTSEEEKSTGSWSIPDEPYPFGGVTSHVYHLSWLFNDPQHRHEFLRYLIRRYVVKRVVPVGCEFLDRLLPSLQSEFPDLEWTPGAARQEAR